MLPTAIFTAGNEINTATNNLLRHQADEIHMSYIESYRKEVREESFTGLDLLTVEERLHRLTPEEVVTYCSSEDQLPGRQQITRHELNTHGDTYEN